VAPQCQQLPSLEAEEATEAAATVGAATLAERLILAALISAELVLVGVVFVSPGVMLAGRMFALAGPMFASEETAASTAMADIGPVPASLTRVTRTWGLIRTVTGRNDSWALARSSRLPLRRGGPLASPAFLGCSLSHKKRRRAFWRSLRFRQMHTVQQLDPRLAFTRNLL
jgi:hypothetical protein